MVPPHALHADISSPRSHSASTASMEIPNPSSLAFYALAFAACVLNAAAIVAVVRGWVRSTPLLHTAVMVVSWLLYQGAFRLFTDHETLPDQASSSSACGFCPISLRFDLLENSYICTGVAGAMRRWMVFPWHLPIPLSTGNITAGITDAAMERRTLMVEVFAWSPVFASCILGFGIGAFADVIRRMMRRRVVIRRRRRANIGRGA